MKLYKKLFEDNGDDEERERRRERRRTTFAEPEEPFTIPEEPPAPLGDLEQKPETPPPTPQERAATRDATRRQAARAQLPQGASDVMRQFIDAVGEVPEDDVDIADLTDVENPLVTPIEPEPTEPQTLPDIIRKAVWDPHGNVDIEIEIRLDWMQVTDLPGYQIAQIRHAFGQFFNNLMGIPRSLAGLKVATTLTGTRLSQIQQFIGYLGRHGVKDDDFSLEAFGIDPEMYQVTQSYVYYLDGKVYYIMAENLMGTENYYVYSGVASREVMQKLRRDIKENPEQYSVDLLGLPAPEENS